MSMNERRTPERFKRLCAVSSCKKEITKRVFVHRGEALLLACEEHACPGCETCVVFGAQVSASEEDTVSADKLGAPQGVWCAMDPDTLYVLRYSIGERTIWAVRDADRDWARCPTEADAERIAADLRAYARRLRP